MGPYVPYCLIALTPFELRCLLFGLKVGTLPIFGLPIFGILDNLPNCSSCSFISLLSLLSSSCFFFLSNICWR